MPPGLDGITLDLWGYPKGTLNVWIEARISGQYLLYSHIFLASFVHIITIIQDSYGRDLNIAVKRKS